MDEDTERSQTPSALNQSSGNTPQGASTNSANSGTPSQSHPTPAATGSSSAASHPASQGSSSHNSKRRRGLGVVTPTACTECRKKRAKVCSELIVPPQFVFLRNWTHSHDRSATDKLLAADAKRRRMQNVSTKPPCGNPKRISERKSSLYARGSDPVTAYLLPSSGQNCGRKCSPASAAASLLRIYRIGLVARCPRDPAPLPHHSSKATQA